MADIPSYHISYGGSDRLPKGHRYLVVDDDSRRIDMSEMHNELIYKEPIPLEAIPSYHISGESNPMGSNQFPAGLRVLVVDNSRTSNILEERRKKHLYEVTKCHSVEIALEYLYDNKYSFDVVLIDIHMEGFEFLEKVGLELDVHVIVMMSLDESKNGFGKSVINNGCDYVIKPVHLEKLKHIWQDMNKMRQESEYMSRYKPIPTKSRFDWSVELHQKFVDIVQQLSKDKHEVFPKLILELMNVPGLTKEDVASHLQKYRLELSAVSNQKKENDISNQNKENDVSNQKKENDVSNQNKENEL